MRPNIKERMSCSVTQRIFLDPIQFAPCGHSGEREVTGNHKNCPCCNQEITAMTPNIALRELVGALLGENPELVQDRYVLRIQRLIQFIEQGNTQDALNMLREFPGLATTNFEARTALDAAVEQDNLAVCEALALAGAVISEENLAHSKKSAHGLLFYHAKIRPALLKDDYAAAAASIVEKSKDRDWLDFVFTKVFKDLPAKNEALQIAVLLLFLDPKNPLLKSEDLLQVLDLFKLAFVAKDAVAIFVRLAFVGNCRGLDFALKENPRLLNATTAAGENALMCAAHQGSLEAVEFLLAQPGIDLQTVEPSSNMTALHLAAREGYVEICQRLVDAGAPLDVRSKNTRCLPWQLAGGKLRAWLFYHTAIRPALLANREGLGVQSIPAEEISRDFLLSVLSLVEQFHLDKIEDFKAALVNYLKANPILLEMLEQFASVLNRPLDRDGKTLLHFFAEQGNSDAVRKILQQQPDLMHAIDARGFTPLHAAASKTHSEVCAQLIAAGASLEARTRAREFPWQLVPCSNAKRRAPAGDTLKARLFYEARIKSKLAADQIAEAAQEAAGSSFDPTNFLLAALFKFVGQDNPDKLEDFKRAVFLLLIKVSHIVLTTSDQFNAVAVDARDEGRATALHWFAHHGEVKALEKVLRIAPALLDSVDQRGRTALHVAAIERNVDACLYLIRAGASLAIKTQKGSTALDFFKKEKCQVSGVALIKALLERNPATAEMQALFLGHSVFCRFKYRQFAEPGQAQALFTAALAEADKDPKSKAAEALEAIALGIWGILSTPREVVSQPAPPGGPSAAAGEAAAAGAVSASPLGVFARTPTEPSAPPASCEP